MKKTASTALVIFGLIILAHPAFSQNFQVKTASKDRQEAVIVDRTTGMERPVKKGDEVNGWRIAEITEDHVTIVQMAEDGTAHVSTIPVGPGKRVHIRKSE